MYFRPARGLSELQAEQVTSRHSPDGASVRTAVTSTNSVSESGLGRNSSSSAENEVCGSADSASAGPANISGRRSNVRRNER